MSGPRNYPALLVSMVALGVLYPLLAKGGLAGWIWWGSFWLMLLAAVRVAASSPRVTRAVYGLLVLVVCLGLIDRAIDGDPQQVTWLWGLRVTMVLLHLLLFGLVGRVMLGDVMRAGRVTDDKIYGAVCFYLMIGLAWGWGFALIELVDPNGFGPPGVAAHAVPEEPTELPDFFYLSFVTLSTVGYGDFVPRSDLARLAATGEGIVGQLFLTILVARLVGLHIAQAGSVDAPRDVERE